MALVLHLSLARASSAAGEEWTPPPTAWGDPDLQGVWRNTTLTLFERPAAFADRQFLTEDEVACHEGNRAVSNTLNARRAREKAAEQNP